jgi:hypothetical protein
MGQEADKQIKEIIDNRCKKTSIVIKNSGERQIGEHVQQVSTKFLCRWRKRKDKNIQDAAHSFC